MKPTAIYIGQKSIGEFFQKNYTDWNFIDIVPTVQEFYQKLNEGDISNDIDAILILDALFDPQGNDQTFEKFIARYAPYCFMGIINYKNYNNIIDEKIKIQSQNNHTSNLLYYFIDPKSAKLTTDNAVAHFIQNSDDKRLIAVLSKKDMDDKTRQEIVQQEALRFEENNFLKNPSQKIGKIISFTSSKGGSGKSTLAISFATTLAHVSEENGNPQKICLLDLDTQDGQIGFITGDDRVSVIQLLKTGITKDNVANTAIHNDKLKIDVILAPKKARSALDLTPEFYLELLEYLKRMYDYVIIDTSVRFLDPLLEKVAYPQSDQIIFVTDIVITSVRSMARWIKEVTEPYEKNGMNIGKNKVGIVINKTLDGVNMPLERIKEFSFGIPIISAIPSAPKLIAHAVNTQSMEIVLQSREIYPSLRGLVKIVTGK